MANSEATIEQLLVKWRNMSSGDRKAIMRVMTAEQRQALEDALLTEEEEETNAASEYRGYSAWLARLLKANAETAASTMNSVSLPTPKVREMLGEIHRELREEDSSGREPAGFLARARQAWSEFGAGL